MVLAAADIQKKIVLITGDLDPSTGDRPAIASMGVLSTNVAFFWSLYADKASVWPRLQELYTQRDCLDALIAVRESYQVKANLGTGVSVDPSGQMQALHAKRFSTDAMINELEKLSVADTDPQSGELTTVEPVSPPTIGSLPLFGPPNANNPTYSGSPYWPQRVVGP